MPDDERRFIDGWTAKGALGERQTREDGLKKLTFSRAMLCGHLSNGEPQLLLIAHYEDGILISKRLAGFIIIMDCHLQFVDS